MKNTLSLENYGVAALTTREMKTTNGGWLWLFTGTTSSFRKYFEPSDENEGVLI